MDELLDILPTDWVQAMRLKYGVELFDEWIKEAKLSMDYYLPLWGLKVQEFLPGGTLGLPITCIRSDGQEVVFKLSSPWNQSPYGAECAALRAWDGRGAVRLLEASPRGDVLLMERVRPGIHMSHQLKDREACMLIAELYNQLGEACWVSGLPDASQQSQIHLQLARKVWKNHCLHTKMNEAHLTAFEEFVMAWCQGGAHRLTHGDFQNKNILLKGEDLVVIDPAPAWSDPLMDLANWVLIFNPYQGVNERARMLAEIMVLELPRLITWIRIQATYSFIFNLPKKREAYLQYWLTPKDLQRLCGQHGL